MQVWPSSLSQSPMVDFEHETISGLLVPDETNNPVRNRTYPEKQHTITFEGMSAGDMVVFRNFYDVTCNQGSAFSAPWLSSIGLANKFLRFIDTPPKFTGNDGYFDLEITVEVIAGVPLVNGAVAYWTS